MSLNTNLCKEKQKRDDRVNSCGCNCSCLNPQQFTCWFLFSFYFCLHKFLFNIRFCMNVILVCSAYLYFDPKLWEHMNLPLEEEPLEEEGNWTQPPHCHGATGEDRCEPNYFHLNWQTEHTLEGIALQVCNFRALSVDLACTFSAPTCSLTRNTSFFPFHEGSCDLVGGVIRRSWHHVMGCDAPPCDRAAFNLLSRVPTRGSCC